jgi:FkbM family methyltransferase
MTQFTVRWSGYAYRLSVRLRRLVYNSFYEGLSIRKSARVRIRGSKAVVVVRPQEDQYQRRIYLTRTYESGTLALIRKTLRQGDIFIDVGANLGIMTLVASECVGDQGDIIAFEPSGHIRERLQRNLTLNDVSNVTLFPYALGASSGSAFLWNAPEGNIGESRVVKSETRGAERIDVRTLDEIVNQNWDLARVRIIKIDVEGKELDVLRGAVRILEGATNAVLIVENNDPETYNFLKDSFCFLPMQFQNSKFVDAELCAIDDPTSISTDENIVYLRANFVSFTPESNKGR